MTVPRILCIVGPTASGKSALSVAAAREMNGEIVSMDSMQVYREMNIGTAKPTEGEMGGIPHHLIDVADPKEPFSAADYVTMAQDAIRDICARKKLPILCGGTGLYLDALLRGGFEETASDPALREALFAYAEQNGIHALHERLRAVDPESAQAIHENNVKRVVRALEIYETTGLTKSEFDRRSREQSPPYDATVIGLSYPDRDLLYRRIEARVEQMLSNGLLEETQRLAEAGVFECNSTAAQAIGYKELLPYLCGEEPLSAARERLIIATRHYAKRQLTWFRAKPYVKWLDMTDADGALRDTNALIAEIQDRFFRHI